MAMLLKNYLSEEDPTSKYGVKKWDQRSAMQGSPGAGTIAEKAEAAQGYAQPALDRYKIKQGSINTRYAGVVSKPGAETEYVRPAKDRYDAKIEGIDTRYDVAEEKERAQYNAAIRQQRAARSSAKREAYIAHERLQKYLPQARAVQGIEGMGMTETAKVLGLNAYLGNRSAADAAYAAGVRDLDAQLLESQSERELARAQEEAAAKDTYLKESDSLLREYRQKLDDKAREEAEAELAYLAEREALLREYREKEETKASEEAAARSTAVGTMLQGMSDQAFGSDGKLSQEGYNTLEAYLDANRDKVSPLDAELYDMTLEGYRNQIRSEAEQMALDKTDFIDVGVTLAGGISNFDDDGNNFKVKDASGNTYKVELDAPNGAVTDGEVLARANMTNKGDIFAYGGKLYLDNGSEVYAIRSQGGFDQDDWDALYNLFFKK